MEQSKSISIIIAKLKLAYPYYFEKLTDEEFIGLVNMYQEELCMCDENILLATIKYLIRNSRYMPSLADILFEYKNQYKLIYTKLIQNSNLEDKEYLLNMVDWYSFKTNYPDNIPSEINDKIKPLLKKAIEHKKTKLLESGDKK